MRAEWNLVISWRRGTRFSALKPDPFSLMRIHHCGFMKALLLLTGFCIANVGHLAEAGTLSRECSSFGKTITLTAATNVFTSYFTALTDCFYGCSNCAPYGGDVPVFTFESPVTYVNFRCDSWWRYNTTLYKNRWKASCAYYGTFVPNQYYTYYITVRLNDQAFQNKLTVIFVSGPLAPENCGPLKWTPYTPTSLVAGKGVYVSLPLKDKFGAIKNETAGLTTPSERILLVERLTLSFGNAIKDLKTGFNINQGFMWLTFLPIKAGAWRAYAGAAYFYPSVNFTAFQGSPFDMAIKPGDISLTNSKGFWLNGINIVKAGEYLSLRVLLRDAYDNNITATTTSLATYPFNAVSTDTTGGSVKFSRVLKYVDQFGYLVYNVSNEIVASYDARVNYSNGQIIGSPFPYTVISGEVDIERSLGLWDSTSYVAGQSANLTVYLRDKYRNLVTPFPGRNNFRAFRVFRYKSDMTKVYEHCTPLPLNSKQEEIVVFYPAKAGTFNFYVESADYRLIKTHPLDLTILTGKLSIPNSNAFWNGSKNQFFNGKQAVIEVILSDPGGNTLNFSTLPALFNLTFRSSSGVPFSLRYTQQVDQGTGYALLLFNVTENQGVWICHVLYKFQEVPGSPLTFMTYSGSIASRYVRVAWKDLSRGNVSTFEAGRPIYQIVDLLDSFMNPLDLQIANYTISFQVSNGTGASCYLTSQSTTQQLGRLEVSQICLRIGVFSGSIVVNGTFISNSISFRIIPGSIYLPFCLGFFPNNGTKYIAGQDFVFDVVLNDAYNNTLSKANGRLGVIDLNYTYYNMNTKELVRPQNFTSLSERVSNRTTVKFTFTTVGRYSLDVTGIQPEMGIYIPNKNGQLIWQQVSSSQTPIAASPFLFEVIPGDPYVSLYNASWLNGINEFPPVSVAHLKITPNDKYGNIIYNYSQPYPFVDLYLWSISNKDNVSFSVVFNVNLTEGSITFRTSTMAGTYLLHVGDKTNREVRGSPFIYTVSPGPISITDCRGVWANGTSKFMAGAQAALNVILQDSYGNIVNDFLNFSLSFMRTDNGMSISEVRTALETGRFYETIKFEISEIGVYSVGVKYNNTIILGSPFNFSILPGPLSADASIGGPWENYTNDFKVGRRAVLFVKLMDIYGNQIKSSDGLPENFNSTVSCNDGQFISPIKVRFVAAADNSSYEKIVFPVNFSSNCSLSITNGTTNINGSPFDFTSYSGNLSIPNCVGSWLNSTNMFVAGNKIIFRVVFRDTKRRLVQPTFPYTEFYLYIRNSEGANYTGKLDFQPGTNSSNGFIVFNITLSGNYLLFVGNNSRQIKGSPFSFNVLAGSVFGTYSRGFWLNKSNAFNAGEAAKLLVERYDIYQNIISPNVSAILYYNVTYLDGRLLPEESKLDGFTRRSTITFIPTLPGSFLLHVSDSVQNDIVGSPFQFVVNPGYMDVKKCLGRWPNKKAVFEAGSKGSLEVVLVDAYNNTMIVSSEHNYSYALTAFIKSNTGAEGVFGLEVVPDNNGGYVNVNFLALFSGSYYLYVQDGTENINGSPFSFAIVPGKVSTPNCVGSWLNGINSFKAGDSASLYILLKDAFNNNVTESNEPLVLNISTQWTTKMVQYKLMETEIKSGYAIATFRVTVSGNTSIHVADVNHLEIPGSPFPSMVNPGPLSLSSTTAEWQYGVSLFQSSGSAKLYIYTRDQYMNAISVDDGILQALIYQENSDVPYTFPNLMLTRHGTLDWIQVVSFTTGISGAFNVYISDSSGRNIGSCPYRFQVFEGTIDPNNIEVSVLGLSTATAGVMGSFSMELRDGGGSAMGYPTSVVSAKLQKEGEVPASFKYAAVGVWEGLESTAAGMGTSVSISAGATPGSYGGTFTILETGAYELYVLWSNVMLHGGQPFSFTVSPGPIDMSKCQCYKKKYAGEARIGQWNYIRIIIHDNLDLGIPAQAEFLNLQIVSKSKAFDIQGIVDIGMGSYMTAYKPYEKGEYDISVLYKDDHIPSCSMVDLSLADSLVANDDYSTVIQGDIAVMDVLSNDKGGIGTLSLHNVTQEATHGKCIIFGRKLLYIPISNYVGNDICTYMIKDSRNVYDSSEAHVSVRPRSPNMQILLPSISGLEDNPINFDGFGINTMSYWDQSSIIMMDVSVNYGMLYMGARSSELWVSSFQATEIERNRIIFKGSLYTLNEAIQMLVYMGPTDFNGKDALSIVITDEYNNTSSTSTELVVQAINDPPYIIAPYKALLNGDGEMKYGYYENNSIIRLDNSDELLRVGDPDQFDKEGEFVKELRLQVLLRVDTGRFYITLPITALENLRVLNESTGIWALYDSSLQNNNDNEFITLFGEGLMFYLNVEQSNVALNTIKYQGYSTTTLHIIINDLGAWGCVGSCKNESISTPLMAEAKIILAFSLREVKGNSRSKTMVTVTLVIVAIIASYIIFIMVPCFILKLEQKRYIDKDIHHDSDADPYVNEEERIQNTKVFNSLWVPSTTSGDGHTQVMNVINPIGIGQRISKKKCGTCHNGQDLPPSLLDADTWTDLQNFLIRTILKWG